MNNLCGKLAMDVPINASASQFHEIFHKRPYHIPKVSTDKIQGAELQGGEWGKVGSIVCWNYFLDRKNSVAKEIVEAVDEEKKSITFKVIEGDLLEEFKSFKFILQCDQKEKGSVVHWTLEYEKLHPEIKDSHSLLEFAAAVSKDIDAHLMEVAEA
ncbi:MLP-like protein 43 isoform X1 [Momordica charantia]|uniref:MLP-like protein 43 isoform X1 n=1 Tax=Momordica charantia TaxID=3673 RepID=A0A6J1C9G5_MOMCH|nr:MLP-like protein 43 isoform X1 [Momordica charantia]